MNEYDITIRETLERTVTVEADSREEARQIVSDNWKKGVGVLLHDIGKYSLEFQKKITENSNIKVDHATAGAQL